MARVGSQTKSDGVALESKTGDFWTNIALWTGRENKKWTGKFLLDIPLYPHGAHPSLCEDKVLKLATFWSDRKIPRFFPEYFSDPELDLPAWPIEYQMCFLDVSEFFSTPLGVDIGSILPPFIKRWPKSSLLKATLSTSHFSASPEGTEMATLSDSNISALISKYLNHQPNQKDQQWHTDEWSWLEESRTLKCKLMPERVHESYLNLATRNDNSVFSGSAFELI